METSGLNTGILEFGENGRNSRQERPDVATPSRRSSLDPGSGSGLFRLAERRLA